MSTPSIHLPESLKKSIEALAAKEGYSVSQFLASAAGEKLAATASRLRLQLSRFPPLRLDIGPVLFLIGIEDLPPVFGRSRSAGGPADLSPRCVLAPANTDS